MFFARYRWAGKVVAGAGFDLNSKLGQELRSGLVIFSEYCQEKNRRGDGRIQLQLQAHEWAVLAGLLAPVELRFAEHLVKSLKMSDAQASKTLELIQTAAQSLAEKEIPELLRKVNAAQPAVSADANASWHLRG
jgi:hypothetical protein